jgi:hypothetical protein
MLTAIAIVISGLACNDCMDAARAAYYTGVQFPVVQHGVDGVVPYAQWTGPQGTGSVHIAKTHFWVANFEYSPDQDRFVYGCACFWSWDGFWQQYCSGGRGQIPAPW